MFSVDEHPTINKCSIISNRYVSISITKQCDKLMEVNGCHSNKDSQRKIRLKLENQVSLYELCKLPPVRHCEAEVRETLIKGSECI